MMVGTAGMVAEREYVHGRVERNRGRHLRRGCNRLCGDSSHRADGGTGRIWRVHATLIALSAAAAARRGWRGGGAGLGLVGRRCPGSGCRAYACSSTGRCGGRRLCCLCWTSSLELGLWDGIWAWCQVLVL